jgi:hypothetical protein
MMSIEVIFILYKEILNDMYGVMNSIIVKCEVC